ncbi:radical SAM protein [Stappia stellulata]|uniref:radical SAM protein n=1 Tax=Stappia stellulata TaxID=71235 RepID=UPI001CD6E0F6|nr:radical SAM protein [Stappia stellulata]MCA1242369.1 radical SAM protein [Stappia stellulata]
MHAGHATDYLHILVVKVVRACNLRCKYCYYINDDTRDYGSSMTVETVTALYERYRDYLSALGRQGAIVWHGGEPLMLGRRRFGAFMELQSETGLAPFIHNKLQTNALLIDDAWIDFLRRHDIGIGVSIDTDRSAHDANRVTPTGEGTYDQTVEALGRLRRAGVSTGVLSVADGVSDGRLAISSLRALGVSSADILLPMTNNARQRNPETAIDLEGLPEFLVDAFRAWVKGDDPSMRVRLFSSMILQAFGRRTTFLGTGGADMSSLAVIETDGTLCMDTEYSQLERFGIAEGYNTGLNVNDTDFSFARAEKLIKRFVAKVGGDRLPTDCQNCEVARLCGGGHPGSRYDDADHSHDHRSAHCKALYRLGRETLSYLNDPHPYL